MKNVHIIENIFTNQERQQLLKSIDPLLVDGNRLSSFYGQRPGEFPGKQTHSSLHLHSDFEWMHNRFLQDIKKNLNLDLKVVRSWGNWTDGSQKVNWHTHPADWCGVYYLKTFPFINSGTKFEKKFVRAPQNSLLLFPCNLLHSAPNKSLFRYSRYSIALDCNTVKLD